MVQQTLAGARAIGGSTAPRDEGEFEPVHRRRLPVPPPAPGGRPPGTTPAGVPAYARDAEPSIEERQLMERVRDGDELAFARLFELHWDGVVRVVARIVGDPDTAGDVAQEVFVQLYRRPPQATGAPLRAWLYRVAANRGYNELRANRRRRAREDTVANDPVPAAMSSDSAAAEAANRADERTAVRQVLLRLPERQRECVALRAEGLSYAEVAAALGVAPASVGTLLARAERAFKEAYRAQQGGM
jgi:RNA polymerase sigma-70 factor (ECF subfamily)